MKYNTHKLLLLALVGTTLVGCGEDKRSKNNDIASPVSVTELKKGSINRLINTTGTAQATYSIVLNSEIPGNYMLQKNPRTNKPYKLGDAVKKGALIIRLNDQEYENNTAITSKKLAVEIAEQEQVKQKALYEKGGVTLTEMRNSEVRATNARYDYDNALLKLEKMNVIAPFDGIIVDLPHYTKGVRMEASKPLVGLMDYDKLYMDVNLPESAIQYVKPEQPVFITHYTLKNDTLDGVISELSPAISSETRTFKGKLMISNKKLKLRPGMFVKADIIVDRADSSIIISKDAILSHNKRKFVYIVEKNTAILRDIQIGLEDENNVEITQGLKVGDNLVTKGHETLRENSKVKVQK
jgi:RND family efflux transporter MFP subunit